MHRFSRVLELSTNREVSSVSGEVILSPRGGATLSAPYRQLRCSIFRYRIAISSILRWTSPCEERYGLTLFR